MDGFFIALVLSAVIRIREFIRGIASAASSTATARAPAAIAPSTRSRLSAAVPSASVARTLVALHAGRAVALELAGPVRSGLSPASVAGALLPTAAIGP